MVFDVTGTLLEPAVIIRDISSGRMAEDIELSSGRRISGFELLSAHPQYALSALDVYPEVMSGYPEHNQTISTYIKKNKIRTYLLYTEGGVSEEDIHTAILSDETVTIQDYREAIYALKNAHEIEWLLTLTVLVDVSAGSVPYIGVVGGKTFPKVQDLVKMLKGMGIAVYLASGEQKDSLERVGEHIGVGKDFICSGANADGKGEIIESLKKESNFTIMVGNSLNDVIAMKKAQIGILNRQYSGFKINERMLEVSDFVVGDIEELIFLIPKIVSRLTHSHKSRRR